MTVEGTPIQEQNDKFWYRREGRKPEPTASPIDRARYFDEHPDEVDAHYIENVFGKIPGSLLAEHMKQISLKKKEAGDRMTIKDWKMQHAKESKSEADIEMYSDFYLDRTFDEVYEEVERALNEVSDQTGLTAHQWRERVMQMERSRDTQEREDMTNELRSYFIPVWRKLYEKGFRYRDIMN